MSQQSLLKELVQLALIQLREYGRPALIMIPLIYEYMNLYLHFPSRSLMNSHYAKRISGILHEAGHTVTLVLWLLTLSLLPSHTHTHTLGANREEELSFPPLVKASAACVSVC